MNATNWAARLKKIKNYKAAQQTANEMGGQLEDGRYKARVTKAELNESQSSGREQVNVFVEIIDGESEGQNAGLFLGLDEKSLPFTLSAFKRMGYEIPEEPEDIVEVVKNINDDQPEVIVAVKNGWSNLVGKVEGENEIGGGEEEEEETEETETEETETEEGEVSEGSKVSFTFKGEEMEGEVVEIKEEENKLTIKTEAGKKYTVAAEKVSLLTESSEEEEEEETEEEETEEEPAEEPKKKSKPAAAKKTTASKKVTRKK